MFVKKLRKNGQITIPKKVQEQLNIQNGDFLTVYQQTKGMIAIKNHHHDHKLNQCVFSNGRVSIPVELRRILNIQDRSDLFMEVIIEERKIILKQYLECELLPPLS